MTGGFHKKLLRKSLVVLTASFTSSNYGSIVVNNISSSSSSTASRTLGAVMTLKTLQALALKLSSQLYYHCSLHFSPMVGSGIGPA